MACALAHRMNPPKARPVRAFFICYEYTYTSSTQVYVYSVLPLPQGKTKRIAINGNPQSSILPIFKIEESARLGLLDYCGFRRLPRYPFMRYSSEITFLLRQ